MATFVPLRVNPRLERLEPPPDPIYPSWDRVAMTALCRDCDALPKVEGAGEVLELADGTRVQTMHNGIQVLEGGGIGPFKRETIRRLRGHHEPQEEKVFAALLERLRATTRPQMIEIGAFWAYYSLWFRRARPDGRTLLLEPDPANLEVGLRHFELNGLETPAVLAAAGATCDEIEFTAESDGVTRHIPRVTVDSLLERHGLERVDLLHCDAQGAELDVLRGAERTIAEGRLRFVVLSTHHHQIADDPLLHHRCLEFVERAGAQVIAEHSVAESYSADGLIVASFAAEDRGFVVEISRNVPSTSFFLETEFDLAEAEERCRRLAAENAAWRRAVEPSADGSTETPTLDALAATAARAGLSLADLGGTLERIAQIRASFCPAPARR